MSNVGRKISQKKHDYDVFKQSIIEDRYGNESYGYTDEASFSIHVMFVPLSSEVDIAEYGERINEMMQCCLFSDEDIIEKDRIEVNGNLYNVKSIIPFPSYRKIVIERVK